MRRGSRRELHLGKVLFGGYFATNSQPWPSPRPAVMNLYPQPSWQPHCHKRFCYQRFPLPPTSASYTFTHPGPLLLITSSARAACTESSAREEIMLYLSKGRELLLNLPVIKLLLSLSGLPPSLALPALGTQRKWLGLFILTLSFLLLQHFIHCVSDSYGLKIILIGLVPIQTHPSFEVEL
jgi:hypothetical protein